MRKWLYDIREASGKTQAEFAEVLGMSTPNYSLIERGLRQKDMGISTLEKIARVCGISIGAAVLHELEYEWKEERKANETAGV